MTFVAPLETPLDFLCMHFAYQVPLKPGSTCLHVYRLLPLLEAPIIRSFMYAWFAVCTLTIQHCVSCMLSRALRTGDVLREPGKVKDIAPNFSSFVLCCVILCNTPTASPKSACTLGRKHTHTATLARLVLPSTTAARTTGMVGSTKNINSKRGKTSRGNVLRVVCWCEG